MTMRRITCLLGLDPEAKVVYRDATYPGPGRHIRPLVRFLHQWRCSQILEMWRKSSGEYDWKQVARRESRPAPASNAWLTNKVALGLGHWKSLGYGILPVEPQ